MNFKQILISSLFALTSSQAAILFTAEAAGVQSTSVVGATTENFNLLPVGALGNYSSVIGNYTSGATIVTANAFGGSNQTQYISVGAQSGTLTYSINFFEDLTYFGFYWGAGDAQNEVRFFNNGNLVQAFRVGDILATLSSDYNGNPNTGQNKSEKYAYLNFTTTGNTRFDQVVFHNDSKGTGFETDNHSIFNQPLIPGNDPTPTPEPATYAMVGAACIALAYMRRR
jgi:hypothetical protein